VANGVEAAHQVGIIHRDLKPSNIILTRTHTGRLHAEIVDFGIAKLEEQMATGEGSLTATGSFIETPRYMSPEQCAGYDLDERSDIYSLGVILYEMVAGQALFEGPTATAIALKQIKEPPPDPLTAQATPTPSPRPQGDELVKRMPPAVVGSAAKKVPKAPPRGQEQPSPAVIDKRSPAAVTGETVAGEKAAGGLPRADAEAERAHLRASLDEWVRATNARDLRKQRAFYPRLVPAFYLWRNVSQHAVLAEEARLFGQAKVIDGHRLWRVGIERSAVPANVHRAAPCVNIT